MSPLSVAFWTMLWILCGTGRVHAFTAQYLKFEPQRSVSLSGTVVHVVLGVLGGLVLLFLANKLLQWFGSRSARERPAAPKKRDRREFQQQAARLGFHVREIKTLRVLGKKLQPEAPVSLLTTDAGREKLSADVSARIHRREREIQLLQGILDKLDLMRERDLRERATVRVDTDLPIWIVERPAEDSDAEDVEVFADEEQVAGQLINLSEGGAAVRAVLDAGVNEVIELWSADQSVWIPPLTAGILSIEENPEEDEKVYHLHFIDPPLAEMRKVIQDLQRKQG